MNYYQWAENKNRKKTVTEFETVEIPSILVTEQIDYTDRHAWMCSCIECRIDRCEDTL